MLHTRPILPFLLAVGLQPAVGFFRVETLQLILKWST
jgi:hypothetical protein